MKRQEMINLSNEEKKNRVRKLYSLDEMCEILGYYDQSNTDLNFQTLEYLERTNEKAFELMIVDEAIKNGNFEESIENNKRFEL